MPAVMKIRDEMAQNAKNPYVQVVGSYLLEVLQANPDAASAILKDGKTIGGSLHEMKEVARKQQVNGCGVLTDAEGFAVVRKYFGIDDKSTPGAKTPMAAPPQVMPAVVIPQAPPKRGIEFDISLDDLLGDPRG